jgi:hypothetical protein
MSLRVAAMMVAASMWGCGRDNLAVAITPTTPTPIVEARPAPGRVLGVVLDFQTAQPIPGAVVGFATDFFSGPSGMTETAVTDANGRYSLSEPPPRANGRPYIFIVDSQSVGSGYPRATNYRGDVAVDRGKCIARYGMVLDSRTYAPIVGATARNLSNQVRATTDRDGWYHIDWGCGAGHLGFNTRWDIMSHPDYHSTQFAGGRGIGGNLREDVLLTPRQ